MGNNDAKIKVEFEVKGFGEDTIVHQLFEEIQLSYEKQPEQLVAKVIIRAKKKDTQITYIG